MFDIIIVTYNAKDKLKKCIRSIERHTKKSKYELTVVDNNSTDGTLAYLKKQDGRLQIIRNKVNGGFSYAANIGLKKTRNDFIALIDDDIEVTKGWLDGLYSRMKGNKKIGIVGGKIVFPDNRIFSADFSVRGNARFGFEEVDKGQRNYAKECDAIPGPCWLIRRRILENVGYFDESFFPCQYEDIDYCIRTRLAGYKIIYNGRVKIVHHHLYRSRKMMRRNSSLFYKKWKKMLEGFPLSDCCPEDKLREKGIEYYKKRDYSKSIGYFSKAQLIDERFVEPYYMAVGLYKKGFYKEGINWLKKTLSMYPSEHLFSRSARYHLWLTYKRIGLYVDAAREATRILEYA